MPVCVLCAELTKFEESKVAIGKGGEGGRYVREKEREEERWTEDEERRTE